MVCKLKHRLPYACRHLGKDAQVYPTKSKTAQVWPGKFRKFAKVAPLRIRRSPKQPIPSTKCKPACPANRKKIRVSAGLSARLFVSMTCCQCQGVRPQACLHIAAKVGEVFFCAPGQLGNEIVKGLLPLELNLAASSARQMLYQPVLRRNWSG